MQSMTGFGRGESQGEGLRVCAQITSVNHRNCDVRFTMPRELSTLEKQLRDQLREKIQRGSLQVALELQPEAASSGRLKLDLALARDLKQQADQVRDTLGIGGEVTIRDLLAVPEMMIVQQPQLDPEQLAELAGTAIAAALDGLMAMREAEGESLYEDLSSRLQQVATAVDRISELAPRIPKLYRDRLQQRLGELLDNQELDQDRLMKEVAWFADKADISEEVTRLQAHQEQLRQLLDCEGAIGRKIDFFLQEMNREANTIGSKANDTDVAQLVVDIKSEIDRMREQANNVQ